jgi:hypothetical protein
MSEPKSSFDTFDDYLSGTMPEVDAEAFEEALFAGEHAEEAAFFDGFRRSMRFAARFGPIAQSSTGETLARLRAEGVRLHLLDFYEDRVNKVESWKDGLELIVTRLHVDVRAYEHVHVRVEQENGAVIKVFHDVGCDPVDGHIYALCEEPLARTAFVSQPLPLLCHIYGERDGQEVAITTLRMKNG